MSRRLSFIALFALLLTAALSAGWALAGWPPAALVLKYGFPPAGGPTGRSVTLGGVEFVELKAGYFRLSGTSDLEVNGLFRLLDAIQSLIRKKPETAGGWPLPCWVEVRRAFWLSRNKVEQVSVNGDGDVWVCEDYLEDICAGLARDHPGWRFRLPTEGEWEYAARAGDLSSPDVSLRGPDDPGLQMGPNAWGLREMTSGMWEVCAGSALPTTVPGASASARVTRGGVRLRHWYGYAGSEWRLEPGLPPGLSPCAIRLVAQEVGR